MSAAAASVPARAISSLDRRAGEPASVVIRDVAVLDPRAGIDARHDVVIGDGLVADLLKPGAAKAVGGEEIDGSALTAVPAFFDPHVHLRTPGQEDKEDLETGTRAAAAGGYCGVIAMANTSPPVDTAGAVTALRERARAEASVPVGFVATVTRGMAGDELTDLGELVAAGAVGLSDDGLPISNPLVLRRALSYQAMTGLQIALHEEDPALSDGGAMHEGEVSALLGIAGVPSISESTMIARDAAIAAFEGARIHVQHLSARESIAAVAAAKRAGVAITCEVTPHHLTLTDDAVRSLDARFKMNPPLRTEADRLALIEALADGTIDCIATDHAPHTVQEKEVPFEQAAMGVTGLETAFAVIYTDLVLSGSLELECLVERLSAGAAAFGFELPSLAPGSEANVALLDLEATWAPGDEGWESRSGNSCFAGRELTGRVQMTLAGGQVAYRRRAFAMGVA